MDGLREYLQKSEIKYIATHGGGYPKTFSWDTNIEDHIRSLGFKVKASSDAGVDGTCWIETTSNISICLNDGFIYKNTK